MSDGIGRRKLDHLELCATGDVAFRGKSTLFDDLALVHDALPELDAAALDTSCRLLGKVLRAPIVIAAMTGGTAEAGRVNRELAAVAEERGYGFGLGSQRAMHVKGGVADTYRVRDVAPTALVLGNLGAVQAAKMSTDEVRALVGEIGADALCIHLNPAMELVQPGGDRDFRGCVDVLARLTQELAVPVIAKETGCGISARTARKLRAAGVRHVDVSGAGGTSWVAVETHRAKEAGDEAARTLGEALWDWGVPTAASVAISARTGLSTVIATGGVTTGLDVAKAIALGATAAGIARPMLKAFTAGGRAGALAYGGTVEAELRAALLLTGSQDLAALGAAPRVMGAALRAWIEADPLPAAGISR